MKRPDSFGFFPMRESSLWARMGDSVTDFIADVEAADEHHDIDADFAHLREIMEPLLHL